MTKVRDFLGSYRLARLIRAGSTCQVWEAIKGNEAERYAIKVLKPEYRKDKSEVAHLKHEFEVASSLKHPRIIRMHEFIVDNQTPFLVMELFSELNMKQALRDGTESLAFLLPDIVQQSCEALSLVHSKGWVHCDVKPDNFLVSREGEIKLIDFSIAQKARKGLARLFARRGTLRGTRSYMAPEQIRRDPVDQRADVYSYGCVLFELVSGRPPYTGDSPNALLNKHLHATIPSVLVHNQNVSEEFAALIKQTMAKSPNQRPDTMWDFLKKFQAIKPFKKPPRVPEKTIFDTHPSARTRPEDIIKR